MGNLRRYYYANKTKIWRGILIVAFILVIIQVMNYMQKIKYKNTDNTITNITTNTVVSDTSLTTDKTIMDSGTTKSEATLKKDITVIDNFLNLCNNKQFEQAYELISDECKENLFKTYDIFKRTYCDVNFSSYKTYTTESWSGNTYRVRITEDPLATGNTSQDMSIQEYMTIVENGNETKLNINNYIGRQKINATETKNNIKIDVISKDTFAEYEVYNIQVTNKTENTIYLDDGENTSTIYVEDSNGIKYEAASSELIFSTLKIPAGSTVKYSIKYTNTYRTNRQMKKLVFEKLILNYNEYIKNTNNYRDYIKFEVTF